MRFEFEERDIEVIAGKVAELLKPMLSMSRQQQDDGIVFTVQTLSEYLKVDPSWIYKQVSLKAIPYFKSGKYTRFRKRDIDRWIESRTVKPIPKEIVKPRAV
jgi:excisionase family DNA binding protein